MVPILSPWGIEQLRLQGWVYSHTVEHWCLGPALHKNVISSQSQGFCEVGGRGWGVHRYLGQIKSLFAVWHVILLILVLCIAVISRFQPGTMFSKDSRNGHL